MKLPSIEALLFDIDGTLLDTDDALTARVQTGLMRLRWLFPGQDTQAAARRLVMWSESPINATVAFLDRSGLDQLVGPIMDALHRPSRSRSRGRTALLPGVDQMLARLAGEYALGIVTAREEKSAHAFIADHALGGTFRCVATARTCRRAKPHPDPILWAVEQLGVPARACLMVGDTTPDIRSAKAAGVTAVGVLCGFGERLELEAAGADIVLDSTADLERVLYDSS